MSELKPFRVSGDIFDEATEQLGLDETARELLSWAMRETHVSIPIRMDDGSTTVFHGYRVQHSTARGPTIGGLRWHPDKGSPWLLTVPLMPMVSSLRERSIPAGPSQSCEKTSTGLPE